MTRVTCGHTFGTGLHIENMLIQPNTNIVESQIPSGYLTSPWSLWPIEIDDVPSYKPFLTTIYRGFSMAMANKQMINPIEIPLESH